jgi:sugar/nucleoside kinase (ribokinase family)
MEERPLTSRVHEDDCRRSRHGRILQDSEALDGTGAGDAFAAGLLYGHLAGWPLERAAALANAAGALAATAVGAVEGVRGLEETLALAGLESAA